jgi:predicted  nucleic acid-binding Zn-ribbon protein
LAAEVRQLQEENAALAARQVALEKASAHLREQEEELKQAQAAQKIAHEKTTAALAARAKEFEAKQQQFREQMKQMLAAN